MLAEEMSGRLTEPGYWEAIHKDPGGAAVAASAGRGKLRAWFHRLAAQDSTSNHILWNGLIPRYVQKPAGARVVEIGSAPGNFLLEFHQRFGYSPYGIEYTPAGVEANRAAFLKNGLDPQSIIEADLFDEHRLHAYREHFDIVFSAGLVEHFAAPALAIRRHVELLAPGGYLVVSIPNLQGFNKALCRLSCPDRLSVHNLAIMNPARWASLFEGLPLTGLYAGYYGMMDLGLIDGESRLGPRFLQSTRAANVLLGAYVRRTPEFLRVESRLFSPHLIYIGRKTAAR